MPEITNQELATMPLAEAIEAYAPNWEAVLPPGVSVDHFKRMVITAVNTNPELRYCDRRTLFNACTKCASDGVLPDGREAALVPFRTKIKDRNGKEHYIDAVQYMIMIAGIRKRLRNSGEVKSAVAEVVYTNDHFHYVKGDDARIDHQPANLDQDPGDMIGAYAIISLTNGEIIREVVRYRDIERARAMSRAKDGPAWTNWPDEMARKVALRRASKAAPSTSVLHRLEQLLDREEDGFDPAPPRPQPEDFVGGNSQHVDADASTREILEKPGYTVTEGIKEETNEQVVDKIFFELIDADGNITTHEDPAEAYREFCELLFSAAKISEGTLEGVWESNDVARTVLGALEPSAIHLPDGASIAEALQRVYDSLHPPSEPPPSPPEPESPPAPPPEPPRPSPSPMTAAPRRRGRPPKIQTQQEPPSFITDVPDAEPPRSSDQVAQLAQSMQDAVEAVQPIPPPTPEPPSARKEKEGEDPNDDLIFAKGNWTTTTYYSRLGAHIRKKRALLGTPNAWSPEKWMEFEKRNAADIQVIAADMGPWIQNILNLIKGGKEGKPLR